jgi:hypothetical protein
MSRRKAVKRTLRNSESSPPILATSRPERLHFARRTILSGVGVIGFLSASLGLWIEVRNSSPEIQPPKDIQGDDPFEAPFTIRNPSSLFKLSSTKVTCRGMGELTRSAPAFEPVFRTATGAAPQQLKPGGTALISCPAPKGLISDVAGKRVYVEFDRIVLQVTLDYDLEAFGWKMHRRTKSPFLIWGGVPPHRHWVETDWLGPGPCPQELCD